MKQRLLSGYKTLSVIFLSVLVSIITFAQDGQVNMSSGNNSSIFASPWVWVVGGAALILLLASVMRGSSNKSA